MIKLSELKNEKGLDMLAELISPAFEILSDKSCLRAIMLNKRALAIRNIAKDHKESALVILAYLNGVSVEEYEASGIEMAKDLFALLTDEEIRAFFTLPKAQESDFSGDASETTGETQETNDLK